MVEEGVSVEMRPQIYNTQVLLTRYLVGLIIYKGDKISWEWIGFNRVTETWR